jgi:hypothetical protein
VFSFWPVNKESVYSVNTFEFGTERQVGAFARNIQASLNRQVFGNDYVHNGSENLDVKVQGNKAVVTWGSIE